MADAILRIKTVMDVGDVVSNVGVIQKSLSKLKLPDNLKNNLNKNIGAFYKEYEKYQKKMSDGIKTQGDFNQIERSLNHLKSLYSEIGKDAAKAIKIDPEALFNLDEGKFKGIVTKIEQTLKQLNDVKIDTKAFSGPIEEIEKLTKNQKIVGKDGILTRMMGNIDASNISQAKKEYNSLIQEIQKAAPKLDEFGKRINKPGTFSVAKYEQLQQILSKLGTAFVKAGTDVKPLEEELNRLQAELAETINVSSKDLTGQIGDYNKQAEGVEKVTDSLKRMHEEEYNFNRQAQDIDRQIQTYFGLSQMIRKVADIARDAFATVKDLDAAMVETAVVTNFDVGDMWNMLPTYTENANQLGSTIKDVYEAATLYYQQGLNQAQSMGLANETLKMARIGGLQAAEATNMMTAALRGFNMEINQVSAKRINDVYSELAAITAADTKEIGSAMERTASIANSANMEFETTSAFLAQMIETTREAPENLGTAMKTIIARFQEMKQDPTKLVDSEGVALDANKIDTALKTIGVDLKNQKGEFRDLDTVFLEISEKWDSLTQGQQRYIATIAAGSRQQSRFIAMMQNYERVKELVDAANNSAGASQKQFEKTLDSMSSKLNRLKNAWDQFTMGLMNNQILKGGVDALTGFFTVVNKIFDVLTKPFPDPFGGLIKSALTLTSTLALLNFGKKGARGAVMAGVGWWKNEGKIVDNFKGGWGVGTPKTEKKKIDAEALYQEKLNKKLTKNAKVQTVNVPIRINPQIQKDYLAKIEASNLSEQVKQKIRTELKGPITAETQVNVNTIIAENTQSIDERKGLLLTSDMIEGGEQAEKLGGKFGELTGKITEAGSVLQQFGEHIGGPFGSALSTAGTLIMTLGSSLEATAVSFQKNIAAEMADAGAKTTDAAATTGLSIAQSKAVITAQALGKALWASLGPLAIIVAAIAAAVAAYKLLDAAIVTDKEKLESTTDAAAAASEAFDSAKQETSELNDAISRIKESEGAFDNLVAGTAEFNEQMVTANEQITELLQKYPMLNDYVSTDKNGLMHVSEEGLEAVKDYQKQIQARASAANIIQSADLAALENRQKAEKLKTKTWKLDQDEIKNNKEQAKLLEQRAEAETKLARQNAIRTTLNAQEIRDVEALSAVYADLYESKRKSAEADVGAMSDHDIRQAYADYHGYKYNKSTKKMKDTEGNEVDYDDAVLKDEVIEQTVLLDFEANAGTLDVVLSDLDRRFRDTLKGSFENSDHVISDILSGNMEMDTDILEQILSENSTDLQNLVNSLSEEEVAAILGISADEVKKTDFSKVTDLFTEKATSLAEAQFEGYSQLASMMAQSEFGTFDKVSQGNQNIIKNAIRELETEQANTLSMIGQALEQNVGSEAMTNFIDKATDIYLSKNVETIDEFDNLLNEINWESAASRLEGYNKMIHSNDEAIQHLGESMRNSADEANIIGEAFDEFVSGDWEKLSENADEFKNAMGEIDGAGIMSAAEQSKSLKALLDSGEVSATAVAKALQGIEEGKYSVGAVDTAVLQLISSLSRLEDVALEAHNFIEGFDPGIDYGEGEDFMIENAKKAQEYMDNQEWGNQQLQNYIKAAAGVDAWNEALLRNHYNMEATTKELSNTVTQFSDGLNSAYDTLMSGKGLNGKAISKNLQEAVDAGRIDETLKSKLENVKMWWDENGDLQFKFPEDLTTKELETYFKEAGGISAEYAKLFMQDIANYSDTEMARLQASDLKETLTSAEFQNQIARNKQGQGIITDAQFNLLKDTLGDKELERVATALGYVADEAESASDKLENNLFKTLEDGKEITDGLQLAREYAQFYHTDETGGKASARSLANVKEFQDKQGRLDISKLTTGFEKVMTQNQAFQASWETYKKLNDQNKTMSYNGQELQKDLKTPDEFKAAIEELSNKSQWYDVGQSIAEGIISYIDAKDKEDVPETEKPGETDLEKTKDMSFKDWLGRSDVGLIDWLKAHSKEKSETTGDDTSSNKLKNKGITSLTDTSTPADFNANTAKIEGKIKQINDAFSGLMNGIKPESINSPQAQAALNSVWKTALSGQTQTLTKDLKADFETLGIDVNKAIASGLVVDKNNLLKKVTEDSEQTGKAISEAQHKGAVRAQQKAAVGINKTPSTETQQSSQGPMGKGGKKVEETTVKVKAEESGIKEVQEKIANVTKAASKPQTIKVGAQVNKTANTALDSIKKIRDAVKKKNTIKVDTKVKGKEDTNNLSSVIKNVKAKAVSIKANVSGASKVSSLKTQINNLPSRKDIYITTHKSTKNDGGGGAKGVNNYISHRSIPSFGSLAKGGRYGRLGPKGKGGLTLTGEKGFEIAWIPSESRSMVLGTEGPQMLNLPSDAVVYTHEQSKKIVKQKSIPAGSHSGRNRGSGSGSSGSSGGSGGSGGSSSSSKKSYKKTGKKTREVLEKGTVSSYIFNLEQKIAQVKIKQEQAQKKLNKQLEIAYKTLKDIKGIGDEDVKRLNQSISLNQALVKSYNNQLASLDKTGKTTIKWSNKQEKKSKGKWKSSGTKEHSASVNLGNYIKYDAATGAYVVDYAKINSQVGSKDKNKAKAIKEAAEQKISDLTSKRDSAQSALEEAQDKLDELGKQLYEQFYSWENELTTILKLTTQIAEVEKRTNRMKEAQSLQEAMVAAGYKAIGDSLEYYKAEVISITSGISKRDTLIKEQRDAVIQAISIRDEWEKYQTAKEAYDKYDHKSIDSAEEAAQKARAEATYEQYRIAKEAQRYIYANVNSDGTVTTSIGTQALENAYNKGNISTEMYEGIKKYYDNLKEQNEKLNELYENQISDLKSLYETVKDLKEQYADRSEELLDSVEKAQEEEVNKLEKLNDALSNALKDLLDEVKYNLDERRKQEDNKKTEQDISRQQQRLAALRADTSGGHQVEIAQLEKEIAEAQQNYGRTLEDQRLDELQRQADEAAKQRQHQIDLLSAQLDQDKENGNNLALVKEYLADPSRYEEEIKAIWKANKEYDQQTDQRKVVLDDEWEVFWNDINGGISSKIDETNVAIDNTKQSLNNIESSLNAIAENIINNTSEYQSSDPYAIKKAMTEGGLNLRAAVNDFRMAGDVTNEQMKEALTNAGIDAKKMYEAGYAAETTHNWLGSTAQQLHDVGYTDAQITNAGLTPPKTVTAPASANTTTTTTTVKKSTAPTKVSQVSGNLKKGSTNVTGVKLLQKALNALGFKGKNGKKLTVDGKFGDNTLYAVKAFQKKNKLSVDGVVGPNTKAKFKAKGYSTGGIADYTGPAWLHGTPSKPELVLNATDTKNFLALKDVLSKAITSTGSIENSYGGDMNFEVNINVDHLNSDYDVDKVADRVRKIIVKDAGYRNVTQVRNFR